jgi:deoxyribonuclease (pyrimidine dimer)
LNSGHVLFFYNKKRFLTNRFLELVAELYARGFEIDPNSRRINFADLDKFPQVMWVPDNSAVTINVDRLRERIMMKPHWYRYKRQPLPPNWQETLLPSTHVAI